MAATASTIPAPDAEKTLIALGELAGRFSVVVIDACESTNSMLRDHPPPDDGRAHVLVAHKQLAGRGRRGRVWQAWPGYSLTFSSLWRFDPSPCVPAGLSLVAGLAVVCSLEKLGVKGLALKWPNDVLLGGKKLAGVLVELVPGRGKTPAAVVGIGLNLALPSEAHIPEQPGVTSLAETMPATELDANKVLAAILSSLDELLQDYAHGGFASLRDAWQQRNALAGQAVSVRDEQSEITGICLGIEDDGALLIDTSRGITRIIVGDVSLRALQ